MLACADSRVAPEIIFDEGLGDLFVVRVAGAILDSAVTGSLEYGAEHLNIPLIVVLGHKGCGAVTAAVEVVSDETKAHDLRHMISLMDYLFPSVRRMRGRPGDLVDNVVEANVRRVIFDLDGSWPLLHKKMHNGDVRVVGAIYDLESGAVAWLE